MVTLTGCSISLGSFPPVKTINANQRGDWGSWGDDLPSGLDLTSGECESLARQFAWSVRFSMNDQGLISEAWADFGWLAAVWSAPAVAVCASAPFAVSAAGASARSAAFSLHLPSVALAAGGPVLVSAGVSGAPAPAARRAFAAVAGISGPA